MAAEGGVGDPAKGVHRLEPIDELRVLNVIFQRGQHGAPGRQLHARAPVQPPQRALDPRPFAGRKLIGLLVQEVLQGMNDSPAVELYTRFFMDIPRLSDPLPNELFVVAADIYRQGRRRGLTIRSGTDCLIAAIALENNATVWHRDRDFDAIAKFTNLRVQRSHPVH